MAKSMTPDLAVTTLRAIVEREICAKFRHRPLEWSGNTVAWHFKGSCLSLTNQGDDVWEVLITEDGALAAKFGRRGFKFAIRDAREDCRLPPMKRSAA